MQTLRLSFFLLFVSLPLAAAAPPAAKPAEFFDLKPVSEARISPDGRLVAYVVGEWDFKENLLNTDVWLVDVLSDRKLGTKRRPSGRSG